LATGLVDHVVEFGVRIEILIDPDEDRPPARPRFGVHRLLAATRLPPADRLRANR